MKYRLLLIACFFLFTSSAFSQKEMRVTDKWVVTNVPEEAATGLITVKSTGFGKTKPESISDSKTGALYILLFRGIAGSSYSTPLISNESEVKDNKVLNDLLYKGESNTFFTRVELVRSVKQTKKSDGVKGFETMQKISINVEALRKFLEQNNIIKKFGL